MPSSRPAARSDPRSLLLTAAWAGVATALAASVIAIAVVAVLWLPAASGSGSAGSAIRAGILTFLAGVHGGITVDGVPSGFVPLGLTIVVVTLVWRAGLAVAASGEDLDERRPAALLQAVAVLSAAFALTCTVLAAASGLGTSSASVAGAFGAGLLLASVTTGAAMLRASSLGAFVRWPEWVATALRAATAAVAVYVAAGALLVAGALVVHHERVVTLSHEVGGGWSSVPVLVLGVLAAPNAAIAGAGYLSGAGFAVGTATTVSLTGTTSGLVPAFPLLGALPGPGAASWPGWLLAAVTPLAAGAAVAAVAGRAPTWRDRATTAGAAVVGVAVLGAVLAWQGGGGIGRGKLSAVGTSPWLFPLLIAVWTAIATSLWFALRAGLAAARTERTTQAPPAPVMTVVRNAPVTMSDDSELDGEPDCDDDSASEADDEEQPDEPGRRDHLAG